MTVLVLTIVGQTLRVPASWDVWTWNGWLFEQVDDSVMASPDGGQTWERVEQFRLEAA